MANKVELIAQQHLALGRLLELTDLMLKGALEQQWESVRELQLLRDGLIRDFFDQEVVIDSQNVAKAIKHIIESDQKLSLFGMEERNLLKQQICKMKQGKNAVKAYTVG
ncbi:MAG: hypothetical protein ACU85E_13865 [Gammaproteobacteria bacterium]